MPEKNLTGSLDVLHSLHVTEGMEGLDRASKELYKNKEVLAIILKGVVREFRDYSYPEIMGFIEGDSITDSERVSPGHGDRGAPYAGAGTATRITGNDKEFAALGEKLSVFDTKFRAVNPELSDGTITVNLHIDLETQLTYRLGDRVFREMEEEEVNGMMEFLHAIMYPHTEGFLTKIRKYIDFSENEELWKEADSMTGLGMSIGRECWEEGHTAGVEEGHRDGRRSGLEEKEKRVAFRLFSRDQTPETVSDIIEKPVEYAMELQKEYLQMVHENGSYTAE